MLYTDSRYYVESSRPGLRICMYWTFDVSHCFISQVVFIVDCGYCLLFDLFTAHVGWGNHERSISNDRNHKERKGKNRLTKYERGIVITVITMQISKHEKEENNIFI